MKKYLISGIAALALCVGFTSCSHDVEQLSQKEITDLQVQQIVNNYNQAFIKTFGKPASNHQWGFVNYAATRTRTADPQDYGAYFGDANEAQPQHYKDMGLVAPDMVSAEEEEFVSNWFKKNKNPESDKIDLSTFFVQQVYFGVKEYTGKDGNGAEHKVIGGQHMDWLCAGSDEIGDDHINNFNTSSPQRYYKEGGWTNAREYSASMMLMVNSSTKRFGFKESQGEGGAVFHNFVLKKLTFNGKVGYYVGFDYENHGQNGDFPKDGFYDDRIIKIVPGDGIIPSDWDLRIIAEDLNATAQDGDTENSDWDFNDVVLDVKFLGNDDVRIRVTAAGATLPIRINGEDALEVHGLYGQPTNIMINTGAAAAGYPSQAYENKYPAAATFERNIAGVDAEYGANIKIEVEKTVNGEKRWIELEAKAGQPAAKMGVLPDYEYCAERQDIKQLYSNFVAWVAQQNPVYWWRNN